MAVFYHRATAYKLCTAGELVHFRISNAVRVAPLDLAAFIAETRRVTILDSLHARV